MDSSTDNTNKHAVLLNAVHHNKTLKRSQGDSVSTDTAPPPIALQPHANAGSGAPPVNPSEHLRNLLDESARDAFMRPWHRLERGLRLNRLRMYVEQIAPQCSFTNDEKARFFEFLQRTHDRKLLNTHKIVNYIVDQQRIESIRGLEVRRSPDGTAKWGFTLKKAKEASATRRKKKDENDVPAASGSS